MNEKSLDNQHQMFTSSLSENRGNPAFCEEKDTSTVEEFVPLPAELTKKISVRRDIFYSSGVPPLPPKLILFIPRIYNLLIC